MPRRFPPVAVLIATAVAVTASAQTSGSTLEARVDSIATRVLETTGVPGASVAVVQHGQLVLVKAYGAARLDPRTPATPAMRYGVGSISKQFTAAAMLLLQQEQPDT